MRWWILSLVNRMDEKDFFSVSGTLRGTRNFCSKLVSLTEKKNIFLILALRSASFSVRGKSYSSRPNQKQIIELLELLSQLTINRSRRLDRLSLCRTFQWRKKCPFLNFIFARESVSLLVFSQCLLTLFWGVCCAWYALLHFEGKVPDRVTAFRTWACGLLRPLSKYHITVEHSSMTSIAQLYFFKLNTPKRLHTSMKGISDYILALYLLPFRNLLCQLLAIQTLQKRGKVYSQLLWMKTSKVYFKGTLNSGKKASKLTLGHCQQSSDKIRTAWQKWSPQQFPHPLSLTPWLFPPWHRKIPHAK